MAWLSTGTSAGSLTGWRLLSGGIFLLATALALVADTQGVVNNTPKGECYCHCSASRTRMGCVKMCELKKYASRWWATSCAKPRIKPPADSSGAGPRFPHPDRAEHAKL